MKIEEAKKYAREIVASYFGDDHVFFANNKMALRPEPYITVGFLGNRRQSFAGKIVDKEGFQNHYREITLHCEVNLYTKGKDVSFGKGEPVYENTSLEDMDAFLDFIESDASVEDLDRHDCAIVVSSEVRDLAGLQQNSTHYQYRSNLEFDLHFTDESHGLYGQNNVDEKRIPSHSNGGSELYITGPYVIDDVEIEGGNIEDE